MSRTFFKAVAQTVILLRQETWVMKPLMVRDLGGSNIGRIDELWDGNLGGIGMADGSNPP